MKLRQYPFTRLVVVVLAFVPTFAAGLALMGQAWALLPHTKALLWTMLLTALPIWYGFSVLENRKIWRGRISMEAVTLFVPGPLVTGFLTGLLLCYYHLLKTGAS